MSTPDRSSTLVEGLLKRLLPPRGVSGPRQTPEFGPYPHFSLEELTMIHGEMVTAPPFKNPKEEEMRLLILRKLRNAFSSDPKFRLPHE